MAESWSATCECEWHEQLVCVYDENKCQRCFRPFELGETPDSFATDEVRAR